MSTRRVVATFIASIALLYGVANAQDVRPSSSYEAVAMPLISTTIKFGYNDAYRGIVTYVAPPGTILRGTTYDIEGQVVELGDVLVHMETDYRQSVVEEKQAFLKSAEAMLKNALDNYNRHGKLIKTDVISMQLYQQSEAAYLAAIGSKEAMEAELHLAVIMRDACTFRAPFEAIVDKVFFPAGLCAGELDIVRISQLSPMGILVKMDREKALEISAGTPVSVYPGNSPGSIGVIHGAIQLVDGGVMLQVANQPMPPPAEANEGGIQLPVCNYSSVLPVHSGKEIGGDKWLRIPSTALFSDSQGVFIWRAIGQRDMQAGKGMNKTFNVEKLYLSAKPGLPDDLCAKSIVIRKEGPLGIFDVVLTGQIPASLKNGDKVCGHKPRYLLMPGDPVKVVIGGP